MVIEKAKAHLHRLENQTVEQQAQHSMQFDMFGAPVDEKPKKAKSVKPTKPAKTTVNEDTSDTAALLDLLANTSPDDLTPRQAHQALYDLKDLFKKL